MRFFKSSLLFVLATILLNAGSGASSEIGPRVGATLTPTETQADFDLLRQALEEAHTGLYRYVRKIEMDRAFEVQRIKLSQPMTKADFLAVLTETLAQIRCGHTQLTFDEETRSELANTGMFPLKILVEGQRLMVYSNDTPNNQTIRPGMEIIEINGRKSSDILRLILPRLIGDADIDTGKRWRLLRTFGQSYWLLVERTSEFTIKARDIEGKTTTVKLAGVLDSERRKNWDQNPVNAEMRASLGRLQWSRDNVGLRFLKEPEIAEIRIDGFRGEDYPQRIEQAFRTLHERGTKVLILDLRGNGGGNDMYGARLVSYLTDKSFRYFDHINVKTINPSFKQYSDWDSAEESRLREVVTPNPAGGYFVTAKGHPGVAEVRPAKYPFLGKVFVLIDGGTFSTAADVCAVVHHLKRATFIGEETGGGYYGNNSGLETTITLPYSKAKVRLPMYEYWNAVPGYAGTRRGTRPDKLVETKAVDLLRGNDAQLDVAMKVASQAK
jgi:C-terminal processing protease CtpA/Prc